MQKIMKAIPIKIIVIMMMNNMKMTGFKKLVQRKRL